MIMNWFYVHESTYNADKLFTVINKFPIQEQIARNMVSLGDMYSLWINNHSMLLAILSLFVFGILLSRRGRLFIVISFAAMMAETTCIYLMGRVPLFRVHYPLLITLVYLAALLYAYQCSEDSERCKVTLLRQWASIIAICLIAVLSGRQVLNDNANNEERFEAVKNDIVSLNPRPDQLFVVWGACFPFEWSYPLLATNIPLEKMKMFGLGSTSHAPFAKQRLVENNIGDLVPALYQRNNVFIIANNDLMSLLTIFIQEHYGVRVIPTNYFSGKTFQVYRVTRIS